MIQLKNTSELKHNIYDIYIELLKIQYIFSELNLDTLKSINQDKNYELFLKKILPDDNSINTLKENVSKSIKNIEDILDTILENNKYEETIILHIYEILLSKINIFSFIDAVTEEGFDNWYQNKYKKEIKNNHA